MHKMRNHHKKATHTANSPNSAVQIPPTCVGRHEPFLHHQEAVHLSALTAVTNEAFSGMYYQAKNLHDIALEFHIITIFCFLEFFFFLYIKFCLFAPCKSEDKYDQSLSCICSAPLVPPNPWTHLLSNIKQQPGNINM